MKKQMRKNMWAQYMILSMQTAHESTLQGYPEPEALELRA
jgi:hypothetical protein